MSASGKGLGLATVVCLGVVTATIVWKYTASKGQQPTASSAGVKQRSAMKGDEVREREISGGLVECHVYSNEAPASCLLFENR